MIIYIHPKDDRYAGKTFSRHIGLDVRHVMLPKFLGPQDVASRVVESFNEDERGEPDGRIDLLVIFADGGPGWIRLTDFGVDGEDKIDEREAARFAEPFSELMKPSREGGLGVEIHGCGAAAPAIDPYTGEMEDATVGLRFLYELAMGFNCTVRASGDPNLRELDDSYTDSLVEAHPEYDDPDWEGHVRVVRDGRFALGHVLKAKVEASQSCENAVFSEIERSILGRQSP